MNRSTGLHRPLPALFGAALALGVLSSRAEEAPRAPEPAAAQPTLTPLGKARQALASLRTDAARAGLKLDKQATATAPDSHRLVLQASPFQLAFYADGGPLLAPLSTAPGFRYASRSVQFPDPYTGVRLRAKKWGAIKPTTSANDYFERLKQLGAGAKSLPKHLRREAEVVVYTLDGNADGDVDSADKKAPPALATVHNGDFALLRILYGTEPTENGPASRTAQAVVATGVRAWVEDSDTLANGKKPEPLFLYRLSEQLAEFDLNGDGDRDDQLLFGDSDGNGKLDELETDALLKSNARPTTDLVDNLDLDPRLGSSGSRPDLRRRILTEHPDWSTDQVNQFIHNTIYRVDVRLLIEYDDVAREVRVRKRLFGHADFRNALIRLRGLTR
jgi:hypothetical protein